VGNLDVVDNVWFSLFALFVLFLPIHGSVGRIKDVVEIIFRAVRDGESE
jgi:hypothetical protein